MATLDSVIDMCEAPLLNLRSVFKDNALPLDLLVQTNVPSDLDHVLEPGLLEKRHIMIGFIVENARTLRSYLQYPEKAKLMYDPDETTTWSNDDLRIYLSQHGKLYSGNHATLLERF